MSDDVVTEVLAAREARAKKLGGRKELIRRVAALSPEAIVEAAVSAYFPADRFIADAEQHEKYLKHRRLDKELTRLFEKGKTATGTQYARISERQMEIFDEMDLLDNPEGHLERTPLSIKYQRQAQLRARVAERKA